MHEPNVDGRFGLRIPAGEIEHLVIGRVRQWLLDPGSIYQATRLSQEGRAKVLEVGSVGLGG